MGLPIHSGHIDEILSARMQTGDQAVMMLDRYFILNSDEARDEYVAAIIHRLIVEHSRRSIMPLERDAANNR